MNDHDAAAITLPAASRAPDTDTVYCVACDIGVDGVNVALRVAES